MRKNHHGKKDRLVKRVFALCLALAVICTCLVPVFATEGLIDPQVNQEASRPVDDGEASYPDDEFAGFGEEEATRPVDGGEAAGFGEDEVATRPVEGGEDNLDGGPNVKETEWGTVIDYGTSTSTDPSSSTETQWSGEDDVVEKPDDKVVVSGDEIKKLQDMVVYRFWLRELNTLDLQDITAQAQINNMTESEYLARNGEVLWNLYFIQAVPRVETIADYSSYIENPSSNRDPKGELRQFDYWYTLDEFGNRVRLNLTDPTSNILDDKTTTVNVYAAWKDGTVGSDEEEDVDHEDLVDKNPVPVDLETKASASYEDEDGNTKSVNLPVEVKNLPSAADHLSVIHMGDDDMESFYESHSNDFGSMAPILGLKISPKNAKGNTVQPAKGEKATVTVSGLDALPEMEGATADTLKVFHETSDGNVEILDVLTYTNGTLTFETSSFSPFVIALEYPDQGSEDFDDDGIEIVSIEIDGVEYPNVNDGIATISSIQGDVKVPVGSTIKLRGDNGKPGYYHYWEVLSGNATFIYNNTSYKTINGKGDDYKLVSLKLNSEGKVKIRHTYGWSKEHEDNHNNDTLDITVVKASKNNKYNLYVYTQIPGYSDTSYEDAKQNNSVWNGMAIGTIAIDQPASKKNGIIYGSSDIAAKLGTEIVVDSAQFPVIPIKQEDGTYKDYYYQTDPRRPKDAPYYTIEWYRVVVSDGANTGKNGADGDWGGDETLKSKYTSGDYASPIKPVYGNQYHLDGVLQFHDEVHINVSYKVQDAGKTGFDLQADYSAVYKTEKDKAISLKNARRPDKDSLNGSVWVTTPLYQAKKKVGRITYQFDGWYTNEACTGNKFDFEKGTITKDTIFYAKYVPISEETDVTITKQVTGLLGDTNKEFAFSVSITQNGTACTGVTAKKGDQPVSDLTNFTLKHNETVTLENVPIGATIKVTEVTPGEHYNVSATGHSDEQNGRDNVAFTYVAAANTATAGNADEAEADLMLLSMDEDTAVDADGDAVAYDSGIEVDNNQIIVTNHCGLLPDTGVLLDTLPYIVILAVVAGGVALLMLRKRRKEDD